MCAQQESHFVPLFLNIKAQPWIPESLTSFRKFCFTLPVFGKLWSEKKILFHWLLITWNKYNTAYGWPKLHFKNQCHLFSKEIGVFRLPNERQQSKIYFFCSHHDVSRKVSSPICFFSRLRHFCIRGDVGREIGIRRTRMTIPHSSQGNWYARTSILLIPKRSPKRGTATKFLTLWEATF